LGATKQAPGAIRTAASRDGTPAPLQTPQTGAQRQEQQCPQPTSTRCARTVNETSPAPYMPNYYSSPSAAWSTRRRSSERHHARTGPPIRRHAPAPQRRERRDDHRRPPPGTRPPAAPLNTAGRPRRARGGAERMKTCNIDGCEKPSRTRGWCAMRYKRWRNNGDPLVTLTYATPEEAFLARTEPLLWSGCIIWTGATTRGGYGHLRVNGRIVRAHRYAWEREPG